MCVCVWESCKSLMVATTSWFSVTGPSLERPLNLKPLRCRHIQTCGRNWSVQQINPLLPSVPKLWARDVSATPISNPGGHIGIICQILESQVLHKVQLSARVLRKRAPVAETLLLVFSNHFDCYSLLLCRACHSCCHHWLAREQTMTGKKKLDSPPYWRPPVHDTS